MAGHRDDEDLVPAPPGVMDMIRNPNSGALLLRTFGERASLVPVQVPALPVLSEALAELMNAHTATTVPKELREEHRAFCHAREARINARSENQRRLRTALWAEQALRSAGRPEHRLMRAHNMEVWGLQEPAPHDFALRELLVEQHA